MLAASAWRLQLFIRLILLSLLAASSVRGSDFSLSAPAQHVALTSDVEVLVHFPSSLLSANLSETLLVVHLVAVDSDMAVVGTEKVDMLPTPRAVFRCGSVDLAGRYCFVLMEQPGGKVEDAPGLKNNNGSSNNGSNISSHILAESGVMNVLWPRLKMEVPPAMETYTADIVARVEVHGVVCYPRRQRYRTWVELAYYGQSMASGAVHSQYLQEMPEYYRLLSRDIRLQCDLLDQPGFYQVVVRSNRGNPAQVGVSNAMQVKWSDLYELHVSAPSVFPCRGVVNVSYKHPRCILDNDKLRLFARLKPNVSAVASADSLQYLSERRVEKGAGRVAFPCEDFPRRKEFVGFCFTYVSTAKSGAVADLRTDCRPSSLTADLTGNGNWGKWSGWTDCSVTCGRGTRNRHRFCDSPPASKGGSFCAGAAVKVDPCTKQPCPVPSTSPSPVDVAVVGRHCRCGCKMNISGSAVLAASRYYCNNTSIWLLQVRRGHRLQVHFDFLHLESDDEWVTVRDGEFFSSQMLVFGSGLSRVLPAPITSSTNTVLLEFQPLMPPTRDSGKSGTGFVIVLQEVAENGAVVVQNIVVTKPGLMGSAVHWVALALCCFALLAAVALVVLHWIRRAKWREEGRLSSTGSVHSQSGYQPFQAITTTTSVSDFSISQRARRKRRKKKMKCRKFPMLSPVSSDGGTCYVQMEEPLSPEDFMQDAATLFNALPSSKKHGSLEEDDHQPIADGISSQLKSPPLGRRPTRQVALVQPEASRKLPVATVSPQPHRPTEDPQSPPATKRPKEEVPPKSDEGVVKRRSKHLDSGLDGKSGGTKPHHRRSGNGSGDRRSKQLKSKGKDGRENDTCSPIPRSQAVKNDSKPKTAAERVKSGESIVGSPSDLSLAATTDNDFEYDYYDYNVHDVPGSFFSVDPELLAWLPPFIPQPPSPESMMPMTEFNDLPIIHNTESHTPQPLLSPQSKVSDKSDRINNECINGCEKGSKEISVANNDCETLTPDPAICSSFNLDSIEFADASDPDSPKRQVLGSKGTAPTSVIKR